MKDFLKSSLKIGVGIFVGLFLLIIVIGMFSSSDNGSDSKTNDNIAGAPEAENANVEDHQVEAPSESKPKSGTVFDYTTWEYYTTQQVGQYYTAPAGKQYVIVTVHIDNQGTATYSTNPYSWSLTADGITYQPDTATYDEAIDSKTVEVGPGGKIDVQYAYLVDGNPTEISLNYGL